MNIKKLFKISSLALLFNFMIHTVVSASEFEVAAPTGFSAILTLIPLIVVLVLLFLKVDMIIAGLAGGILAMIIGGISLTDVNSELLETIPTMLAITVPIINSAVAMAVFKSGGYNAALTLAKRGTKGKLNMCLSLLSYY